MPGVANVTLYQLERGPHRIGVGRVKPVEQLLREEIETLRRLARHDAAVGLVLDEVLCLVVARIARHATRPCQLAAPTPGAAGCKAPFDSRSALRRSFEGDFPRTMK